MNKQIVIYHHPQECGCPYFTIISAETGQVLERIDLPEPQGYWHDGRETFEQPQFLFEEKIEGLLCTQPFEIGKMEKICWHERYNGKPVNMRVLESVTPTEKDGIVCLTYRYFTTHNETKWDASKDEYRKEMERLGYDMSKWHPYIRRKTEYKDFLRSLYPNALNMVFIS